MGMAFETLRNPVHVTKLYRLSFVRDEVQNGKKAKAVFVSYFDDEDDAKEAGRGAARTGGSSIRIDRFIFDTALQLTYAKPVQ